MESSINYDEVIETNGIKIPYVPDIITPPIERPMRNNRYEKGECAGLQSLLRPGDRVLELGGGVGLLSTVAALTEGVEHVVTVEGNPALIPLIRETHRLNGVQNTTLLNGIACKTAEDAKQFYIRKDFWASSMEPDSRPYTHAVTVPAISVGALIAEHKPSVIVCDIEGGELGLFDDLDLSGVRTVIMEFHPKVYGEENVAAIQDVLGRHGLALIPSDKASSVRSFERTAEVTPHPAAQIQMAPGPWPPADPRFFIATCMKDEGPFILEWIAWHRSIGVQDFVVFTNDCSDGTDLILDRLDEMGYLRHLPNPALATDGKYLQPLALNYTPYLREWARADFFISMDVDEFINIRTGTGHLKDLLNAVPEFDALSIAELNHGSNNRIAFEPGLLTEQFPCHEQEKPGPKRAHRGVKTIVRLSDKLEKPRNHRPDFHHDRGDVSWLDGSGRRIETLHEDRTLNGIDVRGTYDLVSLDHFALRSLDSYLIKMFRGDVVVKDKKVGQRYWRIRNRNGHQTSTFERQQPGFRAELARLMADEKLRALHDRAGEIHQQRAMTLLEMPEFQERRDWIFENAWHGEQPVAKAAE